MRTIVVLHWLLRLQVILGVVQFVGMFAGFGWPPSIWIVHRLNGIALPVVAFIAFRRSAWERVGRSTARFEPRVRVAARFALLAPLTLGLCFAFGLLYGRGWVAVHVVVAIVAMFVIERAVAELTPDFVVRRSARERLQGGVDD